MKYRILKDFSFAHGGYEIKAYVADTEREVKDAEFHAVATAEGWVEPVAETDAADKKEPPAPPAPAPAPLDPVPPAPPAPAAAGKRSHGKAAPKGK